MQELEAHVDEYLQPFSSCRAAQSSREGSASGTVPWLKGALAFAEAV